MPFKLHVVDDSPTAGVSGLSVALKKGKRDAATRMTVYLTEKVSTELSLPIGTMLEVHVGTDDVHGLLRLRKNEDAIGGAKVVGAGKGKFARIEVNLGYIPGFVDRDEPRQPCHYEEVDGFVEIVLPPWAEETHPTKPKVALPPIEKPKPLVEVKRPALGRRMTVVPNFGDPPRNRSALVAGAAARMDEQARLQLAEKEAQRANIAARQGGRPAATRVQGDKVAPALARILMSMLDGKVHSHDELFQAMGSSAKNNKIVQTTISLYRPTLVDLGITVTSVHGVGLRIEEESIAAATEVVRKAGLLETAA